MRMSHVFTYILYTDMVCSFAFSVQIINARNYIYIWPCTKKCRKSRLYLLYRTGGGTTRIGIICSLTQSNCSHYVHAYDSSVARRRVDYFRTTTWRRLLNRGGRRVCRSDRTTNTHGKQFWREREFARTDSGPCRPRRIRERRKRQTRVGRREISNRRDPKRSLRPRVVDHDDSGDVSRFGGPPSCDCRDSTSRRENDSLERPLISSNDKKKKPYEKAHRCFSRVLIISVLPPRRTI